MHRLLSLRKIKLQQLNGMTLYTNEVKSRLNLNERTCTLCKQSSGISRTFTRNQSTDTTPILKPPRKKRLRGVKKYFDVLVVTDKSTTEKKTVIKRLTSEDLKFLAMTNLNLGELYKLKEMMGTNKVFEERTYNNLTIIENIPTTVENISPPVTEPVQPVIEISKILNLNKTIDTDVDILNTKILEETELFQTILPASNAFQPEVLEEDIVEVTEKVLEEDIVEVTQKTEEFKDSHKEKTGHKNKKEDAKKEIISRTLASYIETCSVANMFGKGMGALWAYRAKTRSRILKNPLPITNINVYNAALKAAANCGDFLTLQEVLKYAKAVEIDLNIQSYSAILECLGRCNLDNNHMKYIRAYAKDAKFEGYTFDKIMNEVIFVSDEREQVLYAMRAYDRNYIPKYTPPNVQYSNELLNHLNNKEQLNYEATTNSTSSSDIFSKQKMETLISEQMEIENHGYITVKNIENTEKPTPEILKSRKSFDGHLKTWQTTARKAFNRDLASISAQKHNSRLLPYIKSIPTTDIVNILIQEAKLLAQGSETYSPTAGQLYKELGGNVYARYKILRKKKTKVLDKVLAVHTEYCNHYTASHPTLDVLPKDVSNLNTRQMWQWIEYDLKPNGSSIELDHQPWVPSVLQSIGKFLYNIIVNDFKVDSNAMKANSKNKNLVPAFYTIFRHQGRIIKEEVKPHPTLSKLYKSSAPETLSFPTSQIPMKCPPVPWSSLNIGGYLVTPTDFMRLPSQAITQRQRLAASRPELLYPSFDALNQLAAVPWKVNKKILDCILEVFINGGSAKLDVPENPSTLTPPVSPATTMDKLQKYQFFRQKLQHRRKKAEMYSLWCDCLYRLSLANHFKDDVFWLPHNMDFRGRSYPVPPHLNHLGSDLARSMLVFAEGRPLGKKGLDWLKIHLVNLTGLKKRDCVQDRLAFANEIMDKILDSADKPLTGDKWWTCSDEPWQTLACCMEIAAASRSKDPTKFRSHFPVHQDGSCNGLQHYAALGRDRAGGYSVNLCPALKPQDVYSAVAALVEERRSWDEQAGVEIAKILKGFVKRKVIKQTVMTTVYGVTRYGARLQIARQLKDIDDFPKESVWAASVYLTTNTFESLATMFTSTREIQDWFTECARLIASVCCANVEWVTPLGLPIVQPYFKYKQLSKDSFYEAFHMDKYEKPNVLKQKNAFPPNFIHSLDSSHMMLTSLNCEREGITFVSVHDCYWTHPSTVHIMNKICREQFVALHSEPILEDLSAFFVEKYSYNQGDFRCDGSASDVSKTKLNKVLQRLPKTGNFNIKEVLKSVYFFS